jgi:hypothetical protein
MSANQNCGEGKDSPQKWREPARARKKDASMDEQITKRKQDKAGNQIKRSGHEP